LGIDLTRQFEKNSERIIFGKGILKNEKKLLRKISRNDFKISERTILDHQ